MRRTAVLLFVLFATAAMSGCFGRDPESALGRTAQVEYQVIDVQTGEVLWDEVSSPEFVVGGGGSGLGRSFELALRDVAGNGSFDITLTPGDQPRRHLIDVPLSPQSALQRDQDATQIALLFGVAPDTLEAGQTHESSGLRWRIEQVENGTADLRLIAFTTDEAARNPQPAFGVDIVYGVDGDLVRAHLEPHAGTYILVGEGHPFGLPPGIYRIAAQMEQGHPVAVGNLPAIIDRAVRVTGNVTQLTGTGLDHYGAVPKDDGDSRNFGERLSPRVLD